MLTFLMDALFLCALVIGVACFLAAVVIVCLAALGLARTLYRSVGAVHALHRHH